MDGPKAFRAPHYQNALLKSI